MNNKMEEIFREKDNKILEEIFRERDNKILEEIFREKDNMRRSTNDISYIIKKYALFNNYLNNIKKNK